MTRACTGLATFVFAVFTPAPNTPLLAQIEHRVQHPASGTAGRALDKNPQVGSGGYNSPRLSPFDGGLGARSIITGNVTGLGRFHEESPIINNNQFRAGLPSAGLSGFTATSVGLRQIISGRSLRPTYYLGTQETIPDAGFLRRRLNRPGASLLITPLTRTPTPLNRLPDKWRPTLPDPTDRRLDITSLPVTTGVIIPGARPSAQSSIFDKRLRSPFDLAAGSSIFGTPLPGQLPAPLPEPDESLIERWMTGRVNLEPRSPLIPSDDESKQDERRKSSPLDRPEDAELAGPRTDRITGIQTPEPPADRRLPIPGLKETRPLHPGEDRFSDLMRAVGEAQRQGNRRLGFLGRTRPVERPPPTQARESAPSARKQVAQLAATMRWADHLLRDPVKSFAGRNQNRLNQFLAAAESALRAGHYYEADEQYQLALTIDPTNPLPMLGRGHALIAAGDYISAALWIERGIRRFPQITAFRLDLPSIVGRHDVFDIRRADLEERLAIEEHHRLRFLLGYIELYSGLQNPALRDLERAAEQAPQGSIIAIFPDLVLGRRELPPLPEDNPSQ